MRPRSIVRYELCYLGAVALGAAATALMWRVNLNSDEMKQIQNVFGASFLPVFFVFVYTLSLVLWYFTARVPNLAAKWIVTGWFALSLAALAMSVALASPATDVAGLCSIGATVLNAIAVYLLFRPDARAWFGETA